MTKLPQGWDTVPLIDCSLGKPGYGANSPAIEYDPTLPRYVRITDITADGRLTTEGAVSVKLEGNEKFILRDNDFLFARSGATVGKTYLYRSNDGLAIYAGYLIKFCLDERVLLAEYLKQFTQSSRYALWVKNMLRAGAQPNINATEYSSLPIPLPPLSEQHMIVQILRTWDDAIAVAEQLVAALQRRKKGLMQRLLTGQVRFPEFEGAEWEDVELGDHLTPVLRTEPVEAGKEYRLIGVRWYLAGAHIHDVVPGDKIVTQALSRIEENDILYNKMWVSKAAFAVAKKEHAGAYGSGEYPQFVAGDGIDVRFIEYAFHDPRFLHDAKALCRGTTGRIRLHPDDFLRLRMRLPSRSEQGRIAEVLQVADQEIEATKQYLDGLRSQKKGLMQRLLTGQVRVQV